MHVYSYNNHSVICHWELLTLENRCRSLSTYHVAAALSWYQESRTMDFSILRITVNPPTASFNSSFILKAGAYFQKRKEAASKPALSPVREIPLEPTDLASKRLEKDISLSPDQQPQGDAPQRARFTGR